jgi:heptose I phosphotransferase
MPLNPPAPSISADVVPSFWRRLLRGFRILRSSPRWENFVGSDWPARIMSEEVTDRFHAKQGRSIGRWTLADADGCKLVVYLKRHYRLPRWSGLLSALLPSRAASPGLQEWNHLHRAAALGLPVPNPVAAGQFTGPWGRMQGFLAVEELAGMLPLHEAVPLAGRRLELAAFSRWKRALAREMARLSRLLHDRGYYHKDLYLCHFYIHEDDTRRVPDDWRQRVVVIDLHRLARHCLTGPWWRIKDLGQLLYSSEVEGVTDRDRLAFWRAYAGKRRSRSLLARLVRKKWRLYRRHNRKRSGLAD